MRRLLLVLAGCGSTGPDTSNTTSPSTTPDPTTTTPSPGTDTESSPGTPDFQTDIVPVLYRSCGAGDNTCHSRVAYHPLPPQCLGWLALEDVPLGAVSPTTGDPTGCPDRDLYTRLLETPSWGCFVDGWTINYVVPGSLEDSYLWQKVLPDGVHCYGSDVMPFDRPLDPLDRELLEEWIVAGAPG